MFMIRKLGEKVATSLAVFGMVIGTHVGLNNLFNNREYTSETLNSITRANGLYNSTKFSVYHNGDYRSQSVSEHTYYGFGSTVTITDSDFGLGIYDGLVDEIKTSGDNFPGTDRKYLSRHQDYDQFRGTFDAADKKLATTKKKFARHFR